METTHKKQIMMMNETPNFFVNFVTNVLQELNDAGQLQPIIERPSFRRNFNKMYQDIVLEQISEDDRKSKIEILENTFKMMIKNYLNNYSILSKMYDSDFNNDVFQNHTEIMSYLKIMGIGEEAVKNWVVSNISIKSLLNMLQQKYNKISESSDNIYTSFNQINSEYGDIINMMSQVYKKCKNTDDLETVSPLRFDEFHNKITRIHLKATTRKVDYPQYYIEEPVVTEGLSFKEPLNSYELAEWATKVKNCVYSYGDRISDGGCSIFLVEKDQKPYFTVEVRSPNSKTWSFGQVEKLYRSSADADERNKVTSIITHIINEKSKNNNVRTK